MAQNMLVVEVPANQLSQQAGLLRNYTSCVRVRHKGTPFDYEHKGVEMQLLRSVTTWRSDAFKLLPSPYGFSLRAAPLGVFR